MNAPPTSRWRPAAKVSGNAEATVLRGALIGCGFFARNHLNAWRELPRAQIVALCDTDAARLERTARDFGIVRIYASAAELLALERLDFVDIATTVGSHRALVEAAAAARLPCICQKPFAATLEDARAMVAACEAAVVPLMVHENFRWQAPIRAVKAALEAGAIGEPFWARVSFRSAHDVFTGQPYLATDERFILQDLGIHILDIARCLFGEATMLAASTQRINGRICGEDVATLLMRHQGGLTSVIDCSYSTALPQELFPQTLIEVDGREGTLRLGPGYALSVHRKGGTTTESRCDAPLHAWSERPWHVIQDSVLNIQAHWLDCLRSGQSPQTSGADNLRTLELLEAAYDSAACAPPGTRDGLRNG